MIRCCVKNCDTDENVVNCTSVFFVGFPSDDSLRAQWLEVLASSVRDEESESAKICSCHFGEEAFGMHPVHGYRFLLPNAIPSVFPVSLVALLPAGVPEVAEQEDLSLLVEEEELITYHEVEEEEEDAVPVETIQEQNPPEMIEFDPEEDDLMEEQPSQPAKTIGIEYANGKYYFLQSEDESDEERVERDSHISLLEALPAEEDAVADIVLEEANVGQDRDEYDAILKDEEVVLKTELDVQEQQVVADPDVSTELDSLITTSELVDDDGLSEMSNAELVTVKQEDEGDGDVMSEYFVEVKTADGETVKILEQQGGTTSVKEKKVLKHFCGQCSKGFQYESGLKKHLLVHNGQKPHSCETCGKSFSQKINLTIHLRKHTGEEPLRKFTCPVCEKKCIRLSELKLHIKSHWRKQPHACPLCTERFRDVTNFYDHIKSDHKNELTLQEAIDMIAQNENAEVIVPGAEEGQVRPDEDMLDKGFYTCTVCVRTFRTDRLLKKHKRKMHPKVFACAHCPKQFLYKSLLDKHSRVHTQEKPFFCEFCQSSFSQKINLEVHLVKRHNVAVGKGKVLARKHLPCPHCSKLFDRPSSLNIHLRSHTRERPFDCEDCGKKFTTNSTLVAHVRTHHRGESILLHPAKRLSLVASSSGNSLDDGDPVVIVPDELTFSNGQDAISVVSGDVDNVNVIRYSIQFITPSEQGDGDGV